MRVTKDLSSDRFNTGIAMTAPVFRSAQMILRGTFVYGALVNDGTPIGVYATSLRPYDLKSQKNVLNTNCDLLYLDKTLEPVDSIMKTVSKGDKRFEQTQMIGDKECYVFKPEGFNLIVYEEFANLVNLYTTDEILETLNECYPEQGLIKNAFKVDIHFNSNWIDKIMSSAFYRYLNCRVLSEGGLFLESSVSSTNANRVQRPSSIYRFIDGSLSSSGAILSYRGERGLNSIVKDKYSHRDSYGISETVSDVFKCMGIRRYYNLSRHCHLFEEDFKSETLVLPEIIPYISALRLYKDKEAFIRHCCGIVERVYTTRCNSKTIRLMKEVVTTMVENDSNISTVSCFVVVEEIKNKKEYKLLRNIYESFKNGK